MRGRKILQRQEKYYGKIIKMRGAKGNRMEGKKGKGKQDGREKG
jgi:hypothetical protein